MGLGDVTTKLVTVIDSIPRGDDSPSFHSEGAENTTMIISSSRLTPCQHVSDSIVTTSLLQSLLTRRRNLTSIIVHQQTPNILRRCNYPEQLTYVCHIRPQCYLHDLLNGVG